MVWTLWEPLRHSTSSNPSSSRMGGSYTSTLPRTFITCMGTTVPLSVLNLGLKIILFSLEVSFLIPRFQQW
jgi:hypothetical protein